MPWGRRTVRHQTGAMSPPAVAAAAVARPPVPARSRTREPVWAPAPAAARRSAAVRARVRSCHPPPAAPRAEADMRARRAHGFTLIELLVALFITAIMFAFGYRALDEAFRSRREVDEQSARLIAVQQAIRTLEQDFELLQPRPVRNLIGDGYLPALAAVQNTTVGGLGTIGSSARGLGSSSGLGSTSSINGTTGPLITFTRGGWTNPAGIQRSELQRVSYTLENGTLMRLYYPVLDATEGGVPIKR